MLHFHFKKTGICELVFRTRFCLVLYLISCFVKLKPLENAQLCSVLPSVARIPHCYGEAKGVIRITAQPKVNVCNQVVKSDSGALAWKIVKR